MGEGSEAGARLSLFGAIVGIFGVFAAFLLAYQPMINAELAAARPDEAIIVSCVIPFLSDIGIMGGVLWPWRPTGSSRRRTGLGR